MPQNFRLMVNGPSEYIDLFPVTDANSILINGDLYRTSTSKINIPIPDDYIQEISITTSVKEENAPFDVYLVPKGDEITFEEKNAYSTISQIKVTPGKLVITRLNNLPTTDIDISLVFYRDI